MKFPSDFAGPAVHETSATLRRRPHRGRIPLVRLSRSEVGPGFPGAPQTVATGRHRPRSTLPRLSLDRRVQRIIYFRQLTCAAL